MIYSTLSPISIRLWRYAFFLLVPFLLVHLCGFQEHVAVLSGVHSGDQWDHMWGGLYILLYLSTLSLVPILGFAGGLLWIWNFSTVNFNTANLSTVTFRKKKKPNTLETQTEGNLNREDVESR